MHQLYVSSCPRQRHHYKTIVTLYKLELKTNVQTHPSVCHHTQSHTRHISLSKEQGWTRSAFPNYKQVLSQGSKHFSKHLKTVRVQPHRGKNLACSPEGQKTNSEGSRVNDPCDIEDSQSNSSTQRTLGAPPKHRIACVQRFITLQMDLPAFSIFSSRHEKERPPTPNCAWKTPCECVAQYSTAVRSTC